ncbi:unnamed protein product [Caenorhabditis angaria]|uniref:hypoxia-inducible factor-proline dioxygenase n=1 Tax=Caenorhabditis angaria TaxID=860376 RepID=A0A9P1N731_9PELO|nr:unnamed protein product [Caenorhabditis angaria]
MPNTSFDELQSTSGILNSMTIGQTRSMANCAYCQIRDVPLQPCLFCGTVAYCSTEHQQFNWKKHKMICKTLQARGLVANGQLENEEEKDFDTSKPTTSFNIKTEEEPGFLAGPSSAFKPYRSQGSTTSSLGSSSSEKLTPSNSNFGANTKTVPVKIISPPEPPEKSTIATSPDIATSSSPSSSGGSLEKIILTDDPDIQIIENDSSKPTTVRNRKRPTPSNSAELKYKDHNKNVVYNTTPQEHQRHLQQRGLAVNLHQAVIIRMRYIAEHVIRSLNEFGWAVVDNFLGAQHSKFAATEIEQLYKCGLFTAGQLMENKNKDEFHIKDIRSDQIYWFDGVDERAKDAATVRLLVCMIDSVIQHFKNRIEHNIGGRSRAMLAIYPGNGTRYVKHVDNPVKDGRCITTIYYCNENWDMQKDGGTLRLYPESSLTPMDIDPRMDRLVFFWSDRRNPHEVMPVYRHRFAITIWYMDKAERDKALAQKSPTRAKTSLLELSDSRDMRVFPSTSSDPTLAHNSDSGVELDSQAQNVGLGRAGSLQSVSDAFKSERSAGRRSSTSSSQDFEEELPPPPSENPEYII